MRFLFSYKRLAIITLFAGLFAISSCKKTLPPVSQSTLEQYFEENILNKQFVVELAKDDTTIKTSDFDGYSFILTRTTSYYEGPMTGTKNGVTYSGNWSSNNDYSKLVINLNTPTPPTTFGFINRAWRFTRKSLPIMELAPWGSTDPKVLHMRRL